VDARQGLSPVCIGEKDLRHIPRHHRQISTEHVSTERRHRGGITLNPGDPPGRILCPGHLERCLGGVNAHDRTAALGEQHRQASGSAADVKYPVRAQLAGDGEVGGQVIPAAVKCVIDRCQARVGKDRINHPPTITRGRHASQGG